MGCGQALRGAQGHLQKQRKLDGKSELLQALALHVFGGQVGNGGELSHAVEGHDVGMREPRHGPRLVQEPRAQSGIHLDALRELYGHPAAMDGVRAQIDRAHGALAEGRTNWNSSS